MYGYGHPMMMHHHGFEHGFSLLWIAVITIVVLLVLRHHRRGLCWGRGNALGVLEERYAKGEIDANEFQERKKVLLGR